MYEIFETNIKPVIDDVHIIKSLSWDSSKRFADNSVDVCYVDAGHEYECVVKDIAHFWPKIKVGGWLFGDDFTKSFPGVQKAVREFAISNNVSNVNGDKVIGDTETPGLTQIFLVYLGK